jgi:hypothetical protein
LSPAVGKEGGEVVVRRAGRFSSLDVHEALFAAPPEPRSLQELKAGDLSRLDGTQRL